MYEVIAITGGPIVTSCAGLQVHCITDSTGPPKVVQPPCASDVCGCITKYAPKTRKKTSDAVGIFFIVGVGKCV
jgi:hypothetical protein